MRGASQASTTLALVAAGITHFVIGRYCFFRSVAIIGINRNSPLTQTTVLYTVVIAVIFLDEEVNVLLGVGIALVVLGPMLMAGGWGGSNSRGGGAGAKDAIPRRRLAEGYLFGALNGGRLGDKPGTGQIRAERLGTGDSGRPGLLRGGGSGAIAGPADPRQGPRDKGDGQLGTAMVRLNHSDDLRGPTL